MPSTETLNARGPSKVAARHAPAWVPGSQCPQDMNSPCSQWPASQMPEAQTSCGDGRRLLTSMSGKILQKYSWTWPKICQHGMQMQLDAGEI